jgi:hypothetical protein
LYNKALAKGLIKESEWNEYLSGKNLNFIPPVWSEHFCRKDLTDLLKKINRNFYFDINYIIRFLSEFKNYHFPLRKFKAFLGI